MLCQMNYVKSDGEDGNRKGNTAKRKEKKMERKCFAAQGINWKLYSFHLNIQHSILLSINRNRSYIRTTCDAVQYQKHNLRTLCASRHLRNDNASGECRSRLDTRVLLIRRDAMPFLSTMANWVKPLNTFIRHLTLDKIYFSRSFFGLLCVSLSRDTSAECWSRSVVVVVRTPIYSYPHRIRSWNERWNVVYLENMFLFLYVFPLIRRAKSSDTFTRI